MAKSKEEIEKEILKFLDENSDHKGDGTQPGCGLRHGIACALGTCRDNLPRVTPVDFFNDGLTLWILGDPGGKIVNIRSNPNVAVGIYTRMDHSVENRSIQLWGKASLITLEKQKELFMEIITKFGVVDAVRKVLSTARSDSESDEDFEAKVDKALSRETLIKIEPERIFLFTVTPDMKSERLIWRKRK
jgi:nitroimidazol reductase NimA-like FMN-containing flavoprotein (pyridoxamine 5'-phosphate oxidase superfamily)